jgi:NTE family protein
MLQQKTNNISMRGNFAMYRLIYALAILLLLSGCATYGEIRNDPVRKTVASKNYSLEYFQKKFSDSDSFIILAFSGGGTRAAALAYGVLQELRDTSFVANGKRMRLLDEVDAISSVSGGSFTAAYYGLFGDKIFDDFETVFLHHHIEKQILKRFLNPFFLISPQSRTEAAIEYYQRTIFKYATFGDMMHPDAPMIIINASDLGYGVRFSFTQEYFNLLCSDLSSFAVARAVTASSAVPLLFNPVVIKNHDKCGNKFPVILQVARNRSQKSSELQMILKGLNTYYNKEQRKYVHFVDGGITDNLGLRSVHDMLEVAGGAKSLMQRLKLRAPKRIVIISVDASTNPELLMDQTNRRPSVSETVGAMSNVQLHRYNVATVELLKNKLQQWSQQLSTVQNHVKPYFIKFGFKDLKSAEETKFFNKIPTSFSLKREQVDRLIKAGRQLIRSNANYQRLLRDIK